MDVNNSDRDKPQGHYENAPNKFVCPDCIEESFLKNLIQKNAQKKKCDYCGHQEDKPIAAPVKIIIDQIRRTMDKYLVPHDKWCENMIQSGLPSENIVGVRAMEYPLYSIVPYEKWRSPLLRTDVEEALSGAWQAGDSQVHRLRSCWEEFERIVKTRTRYFFASKAFQNSRIDKQFTHPAGLLEEIGRISQSLELYQPLSAGTSLYRVRQTYAGEELTTFDDLGPPPEGNARTGRMNPAGISYFYLAKERETAIGEVLNRPPCKAALATFSTNQPLLVFDLTKLPSNPFPTPSVLDWDRYDDFQSILFLKEFVKAITQPVSRDGREHIDYVPSQVVSEFFAQVFKTKEGHKIDGMIYPSAVVPDGKNVVLFPLPGSADRWSELVDLQPGVKQIEVADWRELTALVSQ